MRIKRTIRGDGGGVRNSRPRYETEECKMQKMKNGLMMFCLTVLLSCAALMMNTPAASAMTLADLQGDYRVVENPPGGNVAGSIISLRMENGNLIGRVKQSNGGDMRNGDIFMQNVFVDQGEVHCKAFYMAGYLDMVVGVENNGSTLCYYFGAKNPLGRYYTLRRV